MEKALVVKELKKSYGDRIAINNLNMEVYKGEIFGLLGHNGAGKTTSIECILGVRKADTGSVLILGMDPLRDRKRIFEKVGVQFQQTNYHDKIRVSEVCEMTTAFYKNPMDWRKLLTSLGLLNMEKRMVGELSGGERQRLSILIALIPNPDFVFLDELTIGLDSKARRNIWRYLENLKQEGLTIFLTSHYMDEVEALCDRICILKSGVVVAMGTIQSLVEKSPYDSLEEAYLWYSGEEEIIDEGI